MKYGFGIDLGGTTIKLAYFNEAGDLLDKWEIPTNTAREGENILPDIAAAVKGYIKENHIPDSDIIGLGIGVPGPVSSAGVVNRCTNLGWGVFDVQQALGALTGFPVKAGNDANVAALGECWKGGGQGCDNMVMATFGTGVGGGIIVNGRLINGANGVAGEIGHIVLNREESVPCTCGNYGCVEQYCSATGIVRTARRHLNRSVTESVLRGIPQLTCKDIFDAAAAEDPVAKEILETVYDQMAVFLADISSVVDPERIVIGGGVSKAGQPLLDGIQRHIHKYLFHAVEKLDFALATLGNDAGAYGAFKLILDAYGG